MQIVRLNNNTYIYFVRPLHEYLVAYGMLMTHMRVKMRIYEDCVLRFAKYDLIGVDVYIEIGNEDFSVTYSLMADGTGREVIDLNKLIGSNFFMTHKNHVRCEYFGTVFSAEMFDSRFPDNTFDVSTTMLDTIISMLLSLKYNDLIRVYMGYEVMRKGGDYK